MTKINLVLFISLTSVASNISSMQPEHQLIPMDRTDETVQRLKAIANSEKSDDRAQEQLIRDIEGSYQPDISLCGNSSRRKCMQTCKKHMAEALYLGAGISLGWITCYLTHLTNEKNA